KSLSQKIFDHKVPDQVDLGKWISVEIECLFASERAETAFISFVRKEKLTKFVTLKDDGSIKNYPKDCECDIHLDDNDDDITEHTCLSKYYGKEIVITFKYGDWAFPKLICDKLNELECKVNKSCGLHVHFDCRGFTERKVQTIGRHIAQTIPAL